MGGLGRRWRTDSASPYKGTALKRLEWVETARGISPKIVPVDATRTIRSQGDNRLHCSQHTQKCILQKSCLVALGLVKTDPLRRF